MNMININSNSNITSIGYDGKDLYIKYCSGATYSYENVPVKVYEELVQAPSKGRYINEQIKNAYPCKRV